MSGDCYYKIFRLWEDISSCADVQENYDACHRLCTKLKGSCVYMHRLGLHVCSFVLSKQKKYRCTCSLVPSQEWLGTRLMYMPVL